jgi:hypothetical protein
MLLQKLVILPNLYAIVMQLDSNAISRSSIFNFAIKLIC